MPLYVLGLMGMTRRMQHYDVARVAALAAGRGGRRRRHPRRHRLPDRAARRVSIRDREQLRDVTGDPWNGRTLEWSTASPPPAYNFAVLPRVEERDAYWETQAARAQRSTCSRTSREYEAIEMPRNSATGFVMRLLRGRHSASR